MYCGVADAHYYCFVEGGFHGWIPDLWTTVTEDCWGFIGNQIALPSLLRSLVCPTLKVF